MKTKSIVMLAWCLVFVWHLGHTEDQYSDTKREINNYLFSLDIQSEICSTSRTNAILEQEIAILQSKTSIPFANISCDKPKQKIHDSFDKIMSVNEVSGNPYLVTLIKDFQAADLAMMQQSHMRESSENYKIRMEYARDNLRKIGIK